MDSIRITRGGAVPMNEPSMGAWEPWAADVRRKRNVEFLTRNAVGGSTFFYGGGGGAAARYAPYETTEELREAGKLIGGAPGTPAENAAPNMGIPPMRTPRLGMSHQPWEEAGHSWNTNNDGTARYAGGGFPTPGMPAIVGDGGTAETFVPLPSWNPRVQDSIANSYWKVYDEVKNDPGLTDVQKGQLLADHASRFSDLQGRQLAEDQADSRWYNPIKNTSSGGRSVADEFKLQSENNESIPSVVKPRWEDAFMPARFTFGANIQRGFPPYDKANAALEKSLQNTNQPSGALAGPWSPNHPRPVATAQNVGTHGPEVIAPQVPGVIVPNTGPQTAPDPNQRASSFPMKFASASPIPPALPRFAYGTGSAPPLPAGLTRGVDDIVAIGGSAEGVDPTILNLHSKYEVPGSRSFSTGVPADTYAPRPTVDDLKVKMDAALGIGGLTASQHSKATEMLNKGVDMDVVRQMLSDSFTANMTAAEQKRGFTPYENYNRSKFERERAVREGMGAEPLYPGLQTNAEPAPAALAPIGAVSTGAATPSQMPTPPPPFAPDPGAMPGFAPTLGSDVNFMQPQDYIPQFPATQAQPGTRTYASPLPIPGTDGGQATAPPPMPVPSAPPPPLPPPPPVVFDPNRAAAQAAAVAPQIPGPASVDDPLEPFRETLAQPDKWGKKSTPALDKLDPYTRQDIQRFMRQPRGRMWLRDQEMAIAAATNKRAFEVQKFNVEQLQKTAEMVRKGEHDAETATERRRHNAAIEAAQDATTRQSAIDARNKWEVEDAKLTSSLTLGDDYVKRGIITPAEWNSINGMRDPAALNKELERRAKQYQEAHQTREFFQDPATGKHFVQGEHIASTEMKGTDTGMTAVEAARLLGEARRRREAIVHPSNVGSKDTTEIDQEINHLRAIAYPQFQKPTGTTNPAPAKPATATELDATLDALKPKPKR